MIAVIPSRMDYLHPKLLFSFYKTKYIYIPITAACLHCSLALFTDGYKIRLVGT